MPTDMPLRTGWHFGANGVFGYELGTSPSYACAKSGRKGKLEGHNDVSRQQSGDEYDVNLFTTDLL